MIDWSRKRTAAEAAAQVEANRRVAEAAEARRYLDDTDWYVTRMAETGQPLPPDVSKRRAAARVRVTSEKSL